MTFVHVLRICLRDIMVIREREREREKTSSYLSELYGPPLLIGEERCLEEGTVQRVFAIWKD